MAPGRPAEPGSSGATDTQDLMSGKLRILPFPAGILLIALATAAAPQPGIARPDAQVLDFAVSLGNKPIGSHRFEIRHTGEGQHSMSSSASFDVRILGVRAYHYEHTADEQWESGCLQRLLASTNANGKRLQVDARRENHALHVTKPAPVVHDTACMLTYAYWDKAILKQSRLLNPQTGHYDEVRIEPAGTEQIKVRGLPVQATRYRLVSRDHTIDLWYSSEGQWLQLDSSVPGGMHLRYRLKG
jgi:hypothetical protein